VAELSLTGLILVGVHQQHRQLAPVPAGDADRLRKSVLEHAAVGQTGQRVVRGQVAELELPALAHVDVLDHRR